MVNFSVLNFLVFINLMVYSRLTVENSRAHVHVGFIFILKSNMVLIILILRILVPPQLDKRRAHVQVVLREGVDEECCPRVAEGVVVALEVLARDDSLAVRVVVGLQAHRLLFV
jgi:hypothetical protein